MNIQCAMCNNLLNVHQPFAQMKERPDIFMHLQCLMKYDPSTAGHHPYVPAFLAKPINTSKAVYGQAMEAEGDRTQGNSPLTADDVLDIRSEVTSGKLRF